ncbi:hypothetical protein [Sulfurisphaera tokodaii]|uniref:Uncharacterized protein n=2 Tax=Sulfurisphaera tokodaii TaxID=111955 RepID=Q96XD4_SULTO|nr:hypothetical protein [Sulfurisphaera tokodaii]BAB67694.1 hypothetical protein STK_25820 [Sulfurisphaera tokodaii str. 7]HII73785.1 hypothetical protein [Sulfurisphaera tokodaii]
MDEISIRLPKKVIYDDGTSEILPKDYVKAEGNLRLYTNDIKRLLRDLKGSGFKETLLEIRKGEKYSLSKKIGVWEIHVRIYQDGFIDSHLELSREYFQHLSFPSVSFAYELQLMLPYLELYNHNKRILRVEEFYEEKLTSPKHVIPWKPVAMSLPCIIYFILRRREFK